MRLSRYLHLLERKAALDEEALAYIEGIFAARERGGAELVERFIAECKPRMDANREESGLVKRSLARAARDGVYSDP